RARCGVHYASRLAFVRRAQHVERAVGVDLMRRNWIVDRARNARDRRLMEDRRRAANDRRNLLVVANIRALEVDALANFFEIFLLTAEQIVYRDHLLGPFGEQTANYRGADKPRASGNNIFTHRES